MGFEVVRDVVSDLRGARLRFGTLALRWRGEPLLHPEIEPILAFLLDQVAEGLADRLRIETDGRFTFRGLAPGEYVFEGAVDGRPFVLPLVVLE